MAETQGIYAKRIVAYGDILGWKEACRAESSRLEKVKRATEEVIHGYAKMFSANLKERIRSAPYSVVDTEYMGVEFAMFSDNFAVPTPAESGYRIFDMVSNICHPLLCLGFLTRGGITVGDLHHEENVIFGPAIIEAANLEKDAVYPRLVCSHKLLAHLQGFASAECDAIVTDHLGRRIANPFAFGPPPEATMKQFSATERWKVEEIKKTIANGIREYSNDQYEKEAEKWRYIRDVLPIMLKRFE